ncbi:hypothetical protein [Sphingomonas sp. PP-CE-3A-406]|uniref:hypothetical protein n=1 Tax=Sphingomonas sp. PP-CE-3A-406 TaxID=2135659 RepID=UPI001C7DAD31|nr:hypothetical protein [Sphingomonas sp. PP-CE-3A-406]
MARDILYDEIELQHYPTREIETMAGASVELGAILPPSSAHYRTGRHCRSSG